MSTCHVCFFGRHLKQRARTDCSTDPKELVWKFWEALVQRCIANHKDMQQYSSEDFYFLPQQQQHLVNQWCFQFPILGFNSGCYDLNLIKKHFVTHVAQFDDVQFFAFAQAASLFLFGFWRKRLGKSRELCQVFFFFKGGLWVIAKKKMGQIISANESHSIQNSATSLDCNTCHAI